MRAPITTSSGLLATPYEYGAGEVSTSKAAQPGLVYENENFDYLFFLCNFGYNLSTIKLIAANIPDGFSCPENSNEDLISNMNYPSIAITGLSGSKTVTRTVTNVGGVETVYGATVDAPDGVNVKVVPDKLQFTKDKTKQTYQVTFTPVGSSSMGDMFGSITWSNGNYDVRSPFVVSGN